MESLKRIFEYLNTSVSPINNYVKHFGWFDEPFVSFKTFEECYADFISENPVGFKFRNKKTRLESLNTLVLCHFQINMEILIRANKNLVLAASVNVKHNVLLKLYSRCSSAYGIRIRKNLRVLSLEELVEYIELVKNIRAAQNFPTLEEFIEDYTNEVILL